MKTTLISLAIVLAFATSGAAKADITMLGCVGVLGAQNYIPVNMGTSNDGDLRNTFESTPSDFT